jgi:hypothetical protein
MFGSTTLSDMVPLVPPSQIPDSVMLKLDELFALSECVTLSHTLPLTVAPDAVVLPITVPVAGAHVAVPGERSSMTALPPVTSTAVVGLAVRIHALLELTQVPRLELIVFEHPVHLGPAAVPATVVVDATSLITWA